MPFGWGNKGPTPAQNQIGDVLFNDGLHVLSSFELNRVASLTYGDEVCDEIFELLEQVQARPMEHSILTVQKSLVITKHIMIYGSEKTVNSAMVLHRGVEALLEFNTVLWAQRLQGAAAMMHRLKGGGVDKGYPVREAAKEVWPLMTDVNRLRTLRNSSADPNSLVPIGNEKVAFLSDDVRHYLLKKRIQEQYRLQTKSNLVKAEGGFGAGYASKDGKKVVGASHGLEEMMKQAQIANNKFSDEGDTGQYEVPDLKDMMALGQANNSNNANANTDLLGGGANPQQGTTTVGDLLDFSAEPSQPPATSSFDGDLLGTGTATSAASADLLGTSGLATTADRFGAPPASDNISIFLDPSAAAAPTPASNGLLDLGSTAPASNGLLDLGSTTTTDASAGVADPMLLMSLSHSGPSNATGLSNPLSASASDATTKNVMGGSFMGGSSMGGSVMSANEDRLAALDSLELPAAKNASSILTAKEAENRLLSHTSSFDRPASAGPINTSSMIPSLPVSQAEPAPKDPNPTISDGMLANTMSQPMSSGSLNSGLAMPSHGMVMNADQSAFPMPPSSGSSMKVSQTVSSLGVAASYGGDALGSASDDEDGFMMGGTMGSGLIPTAAAPAAAPPPPPM